MRPVRPETPGQWRALQAFHAVGRGILLGLDTVPGIVRVRIVERSPANGMEHGCAIVEVWGGDSTVVLRTVDKHTGAGVRVLAVVRSPRAWMRLVRWVRWRVYRFALGRWGLHWLALIFRP